jgi:hypothetical protein
MLAVLTPLFDTNDVSGVHISSAGEEKLCEIFSKYLTALPGKSEFPVTTSIIFYLKKKPVLHVCIEEFEDTKEVITVHANFD